MWHAADIAEKMRHAALGYNFANVPSPEFTWKTFKPQRDNYIKFLNGIYESNVSKEGVTYHTGHAKVTSPNSVLISPGVAPYSKPPLKDQAGRANGESYTIHADHIVVATGGRPTIPTDEKIPGASLGIDSDGFFELEDQPKRVVVVGAGYIAVELAGVLHTLGSEVHLLIRKEQVLRTFDPSLSEVLTPWMEHTGVNVHKTTNVVRVEGERGGELTIHTDKGDAIKADSLIWAIGRHANTDDLGLDELGIELDKKGDVVVDEWQQSKVKSVWAIGDVQGKALLTPVAIAAGRRLSNRLFGPEKFKNDKLSYEDIPTVVFSYVKFCSLCRLRLTELLQASAHRHRWSYGGSGQGEIRRRCQDLYVLFLYTRKIRCN